MSDGDSSTNLWQLAARKVVSSVVGRLSTGKKRKVVANG